MRFLTLMAACELITAPVTQALEKFFLHFFLTKSHGRPFTVGRS